MTLSTLNFPSKSPSINKPLQVLHLGGSFVSDFYYNVSLIYVKEVVQPVGVQAQYAIVHPDGQWQIGKSMDNLSEKMSLASFLNNLPSVDVVVPHLFCLPGMTTFRSFFEDILNIPVVGSTANCTAIAVNKAQTKSIVADAGVKVPKGQLIKKGEKVDLKPPFIIKPNAEDNSVGLTLVKDESEIESALELGFQYDNQLLIEEFIAGREIRVAVIERNGKLEVPSMIEYLVNDDNPIRTTEEKLDLKEDGTPEKQTAKPEIKAVYPAEVSTDLTAKIADMAKKAHLALGCRDYSLFDLRIEAQTNQPYLLEAGLFWSFTPISAISHMLKADNQKLEEVAFQLWQNAANRTRVACGSMFKEMTKEQI